EARRKAAYRNRRRRRSADGADPDSLDPAAGGERGEACDRAEARRRVGSPGGVARCIRRAARFDSRHRRRIQDAEQIRRGARQRVAQAAALLRTRGSAEHRVERGGQHRAVHDTRGRARDRGGRMKVLIADDEPIARQILREHIESIPALEYAGEASTGAETLARILETQPDVVLLDLQMPELDGLAVVRSLRGDRRPAIIFVTAFERYALDAFDVGAVDYLLKPVRRERLEKAILKVQRQLNGSTSPRAGAPRKIVGRRGTDLYLLDPSEIVAFQAEGELVHIVTAEHPFLADHSLKILESKLEQPRFRRIHRRTIINTDHIRRISPLSSKRWLLKMSNGFEAVVSKRLASAIREQRW